MSTSSRLVPPLEYVLGVLATLYIGICSMINAVHETRPLHMGGASVLTRLDKFKIKVLCLLQSHSLIDSVLLS